MCVCVCMCVEGNFVALKLLVCYFCCLFTFVDISFHLKFFVRHLPIRIWKHTR